MAVNPIPPNVSAVTPSMSVHDCAAAIDWYTEVFGAEEIGPRMSGPDGSVAHAEIRILGMTVMLADEMEGGPTVSPRTAGATTMALFLYAEEAPQIWERAIANGAEEVFPYELQFYGDEGGRIRDPFGHTWGIARHVEDVSDEEMARRMAAWYE